MRRWQARAGSSAGAAGGVGRKCSPRPRRSAGLTLLELVATVAILAILAGVAAPMYSAYTVRGHRAAAQADLLSCAQGMERHASFAFSYRAAIDADGDGIGDADTGAVTANLCALTSTRHGVTVVQADAASFLLRASPAPDDALLADDGDLGLDETGTRFWDRNDDGDFGDADETHWGL